MEFPTVTIASIAAGGDGISRLPDGRAVFVPRTAPGDQVMLSQVVLRRKFARAQLGEVITPGVGRVEPACPHYLRDRCGGCQLMHLDIESQRAAKSRIAGDALRRIAKLDVPDPPIAVAPSEVGYRNKVTFSCKDGRIGYHRLGEPGKIIDVKNCILLDPRLQQLHGKLRANAGLLPNELEQLIARIDRTGGCHLILRTSGRSAWMGGRGAPSIARHGGDDLVAPWRWGPPGRGRGRRYLARNSFRAGQSRGRVHCPNARG